MLARVYASEGVKLLEQAAPVELPAAEQTTSFQRFADECLSFDVGNWEKKVKASDLYRRYLVWCEQRGETAMTVYAVGMALKGKIAKSHTGGTAIYRGIEWR